MVIQQLAKGSVVAAGRQARGAGTDRLGQGRRVAQVEAQLHRGRDLVNMLSY